MTDHEQSSFSRDAARLAGCLAIVFLIAWAPFALGFATLLSSASDVPSLFPNGARVAFDPGAKVLKSLDEGAPGWQSEPWFEISHEIEFGEGKLPFWDPYEGYGTPFAAAMQPQPFYPLAFLLSIAPNPYTYNLYVLARLFLFAFGCALFVRMFAGFPAALTAGMCAAFSGYFVVYYDMPHLSVEIMMPWTLIAAELVARRPALRSAAALAVALLLTILGGMPESAALAGVLFLCYAALRTATLRSDGATIPRLACFGTGIALASAAGAAVLGPFVELMRYGMDFHQQQFSGSIMGHAIDGPSATSLLTYLAPLANGPVWNSVRDGFSGHSGMRGAPGTAAFVLASCAGVAALLGIRRREPADAIGLFLVIAAAVFIGKRYGAPGIEWIGGLPALSLVNFPKYGEAITGACIACAAGFGVEVLVRKRIPMPALIGVGVAWFGIITALYVGSNQPPNTSPQAPFVYWAMTLSLSVLLAVVLLGRGALMGTVSRPFVIGIAVIALVEGAFGYLVPMFYFFDKPPSIARDPYAGAPYLRYLQTHLDKQHRVVAIDGELFPDWPGAYALADVRDLNAQYPGRYLPFVDAFLLHEHITADDLFDRFSGTRGIDFRSPLAQDWLRLSSIAYVVAPQPLPPPAAEGSFLDALWRQAGPTIPPPEQPAVRVSSTVVNGVAENTLFEHPQYDAVAFQTVVPASTPWAESDITLDPAVWSATCGGAVTFSLTAVDRLGRAIGSVSSTIDPKHRLTDRRWTRVALDLRPAAMQRVTLRFATSAPDGNTCSSWAEWGEPRWANSPTARLRQGTGRTHLSLAFSDDGSYVYSYQDALPRLHLVHKVISVTDGPQALATITSAGFDPARDAAVENAVVPTSGTGRGDTVTVTSEQTDRLEATVVADGDALLVQTDTWYPGWQATVDGAPATLVSADDLFRGIAIPSGHHHVTIAYESPVVHGGEIVSVIGLGGIVGCSAWPALMRIRRNRTGIRGERSRVSG